MNDPKNVALLSLGVGCVLALVVAQWLTRDSTVQSLRESRRLLEAIGWAVILPQMLATLGILFTDAGVGKAVSYLTRNYLAVDYRFIAVAAYCIGMALFTMIMGNAFAAFPVITSGIGCADPGRRALRRCSRNGGHRHVLRLLRHADDADGGQLQHRARRAAGAADKNQVIKVQIPTALALLCTNIILMHADVPIGGRLPTVLITRLRHPFDYDRGGRKGQRASFPQRMDRYRQGL